MISPHPAHQQSQQQGLGPHKTGRAVSGGGRGVQMLSASSSSSRGMLVAQQGHMSTVPPMRPSKQHQLAAVATLTGGHLWPRVLLLQVLPAVLLVRVLLGPCSRMLVVLLLVLVTAGQAGMQLPPAAPPLLMLGAGGQRQGQGQQGMGPAGMQAVTVHSSLAGGLPLPNQPALLTASQSHSSISSSSSSNGLTTGLSSSSSSSSNGLTTGLSSNNSSSSSNGPTPGLSSSNSSNNSSSNSSSPRPTIRICGRLPVPRCQLC